LVKYLMSTSRRGGFVSLAEEAWDSLSFLSQLPHFLRHPLRPQRPPVILSQRLCKTESRFIALLDKIFSPSSNSPYRSLFEWAGARRGDIEKLLSLEGVEGVLELLLKEGIYLTTEEFKGYCPIRRGSLRLSVGPAMFMNPTGSSGFRIQTSGSRGRRTRVPVTFEYIRGRSVNAYCDLKAKGGLSWVHGLWGVPGSSAIVYLLEMAGVGCRPVRWFSQISPGSSGLHPRYRWSQRALRVLSFMTGVPLPNLEYVSAEDPRPILGWLKRVLERGRIPHLFTYVSSALRLSQASIREGVDISGTRLTVTGEPLTEIRAHALEKAGIITYPRYGSAESGSIGYGCLNRQFVDEVHVLADRLAVVQLRQAKENIPPGALFVTSLEPSSPYLLLNVSPGDSAVLSSRECRCPLQALGWTTHLHTIRSYEKLTSEGMAFLGAAVERILDEILPRTFGGEPGYYQLIEDVAGDGKPRLRLLVNPALGRVDPRALTSVFFDALGRGGEAQKLMSLLWRDARIMRIEQRVPISTASGKVLSLYRQQTSADMTSLDE
jgi:hypothetical protein